MKYKAVFTDEFLSHFRLDDNGKTLVLTDKTGLTRAVILDEVKHGEWKDGNRQTWNGTYWFIYCSECLHERKDDNHDNDTPFCPNCGADMRGNKSE